MMSSNTPRGCALLAMKGSMVKQFSKTTLIHLSSKQVTKNNIDGVLQELITEGLVEKILVPATEDKPERTLYEVTKLGMSVPVSTAHYGTLNLGSEATRLKFQTKASI